MQIANYTNSIKVNEKELNEGKKRILTAYPSKFPTPL